MAQPDRPAADRRYHDLTDWPPRSPSTTAGWQAPTQRSSAEPHSAAHQRDHLALAPPADTDAEPGAGRPAGAPDDWPSREPRPGMPGTGPWRRDQLPAALTAPTPV